MKSKSPKQPESRTAAKSKTESKRKPSKKETVDLHKVCRLESTRLFEIINGLEAEIAAKNRALAAAQDKLIDAECQAAIAQIGTTVRHEINNPLTAILAQTQLLLMRHDSLPEDIKNRLHTIEELSIRIREIVKKL